MRYIPVRGGVALSDWVGPGDVNSGRGPSTHYMDQHSVYFFFYSLVDRVHHSRRKVQLNFRDHG